LFKKAWNSLEKCGRVRAHLGSAGVVKNLFL
jgi:hypothetical protein